ncbi:hypothetical protein D3C72_2145200 [compost metagenome]
MAMFFSSPKNSGEYNSRLPPSTPASWPSALNTGAVNTITVRFSPPLIGTGSDTCGRSESRVARK